jgi:hypothetical protein
MKTIQTLLATLLCLFTFGAQSQNDFKLPEGYNEERPNAKIELDFDGDGAKDLAIAYSDEEGASKIAVYFASKWAVDKTYYSFSWGNHTTYKLSFSNNSLYIDLGDDYGYVFTSFKFTYDSDLINFRLMNYSTTEYMLHPRVLLSSKNLNLQSGEYSIDGGSKKIGPQYFINLSDIEDNAYLLKD